MARRYRRGRVVSAREAIPPTAHHSSQIFGVGRNVGDTLLDQPSMVQVARHVTLGDWGFLTPGHYLIHDRDGKFCADITRIV